MTNLYPLLFENNLHTIVWGGTQLENWKGLPSSGKPIGESWEVSAVASSPSVIANGAFAGRSLPEVISEHAVEILGKAVAEKYDGKLPLLAKFIDADRDLSIQVHPDDELALKRHNCKGKTEMWYIISAGEGAHLLSGLKEQIDADRYVDLVEKGEIVSVLADYKVSPGDVFFLPAGRIHAIGGGCYLAEIQQTSDITYRIYDYGRMGLDGKPRQLHTQEAKDAIDYRVYPDYRTHYVAAPDTSVSLVSCPYFKTELLELTGPFARDLSDCGEFLIAIALEGQTRLVRRSSCPACADEVLTLNPGECALIPGPAFGHSRSGLSADAPSSLSVRPGLSADDPSSFSVRSGVSADDPLPFTAHPGVSADDPLPLSARSGVSADDPLSLSARPGVSADDLRGVCFEPVGSGSKLLTTFVPSTAVCGGSAPE